MPSGGHARTGPPRDPNALRRDRDSTEWIHFPAVREGQAPRWPLPEPTDRERKLWRSFWTRGVANAWERFELAHQVAIYVRTLVAVEKEITNASLLGKVLAQEDRLGLTPAGLARNLWVIGDAPASAHQEPVTDDPDRAGAKARFRSIAGGAAS